MVQSDILVLCWLDVNFLDMESLAVGRSAVGPFVLHCSNTRCPRHRRKPEGLSDEGSIGRSRCLTGQSLRLSLSLVYGSQWHGCSFFWIAVTVLSLADTSGLKSARYGTTRNCCTSLLCLGVALRKGGHLSASAMDYLGHNDVAEANPFASSKGAFLFLRRVEPTPFLKIRAQVFIVLGYRMLNTNRSSSYVYIFR